jgi:hypothetical protein
MTKRRHLAAPLAPVAALLLAACASEPPRAMMAPPVEAPSLATATMSAAPNDLEGQLAALGAAETQIDLAIRRSPLAQAGSAAKDQKKEEHDERAPPSPVTRRAEESEAQKGFRANAGDSIAADPCATACSALGSMERAAKHLCDLTGDSDARCDNARSRVSGATERVNASCPACAVGSK